MKTLNEPTAEEIKKKRIYAEWGLTDEEYRMIEEDILGRMPNYTETGLFSVMWSEHCSYKNSKPVLRKFPTSGPHVLQGPGEGAGIVDIGDGLAVVFKAEVTTIPQPWSLMKELRQELAESSEIFSAWVLVQLRC